MANWNERDQDGRGERGWRERGGAKGAFGESRYDAGQDAGYNPAGPNQSYRQTDYGSGYDEDRSWNRGGQGDYGRRDYGDGGPTRYGRGDYGGDQRRYGQGGYDRDRQGSYGDQRYAGRDQGGYGVEWSDRDSYDSRRHDNDYRSGSYGQGDHGYSQDSYRGDYRRGRDGGFGDPNPYVQAASDGETQGEHRGRGPKDYKRSDDRIREDVNDRLTDDSHIDASGIQVAVKDGEVTLSGTVDSRFAKRHAEDLADRISGARHVQNNLRIQDSRQDRAQAETATVTPRGSSTLS